MVLLRAPSPASPARTECIQGLAAQPPIRAATAAGAPLGTHERTQAQAQGNVEERGWTARLVRPRRNKESC
eukprot:13707929-Alexandrium_andersonii.AAC.1